MSLLTLCRSQALQLQLQNKLSLDVLHLLDWWKQHRFFLQGIAMRANPPFHLIYTDSSLLGSDSYLHLTMMVISLALRNADQFIRSWRFSYQKTNNSSSIFQPSKGWRPDRVAQSVICLVTDPKLTADPGVMSSIPDRSHTYVEIDHEIISTVILLPSAESFMKGCCQLQAKVCARLLINCLFKLAKEKSVVRWTDRPAMTIAVDLGRKATKFQSSATTHRVT